MDKNLKIKLLALVIAVAMSAVAGVEFYRHRNYKEAMVLGDSVSVKKLSEYDPAIAGTVNDCNIYVIDSGVPGGTVMVFGGTHAEEPVGPILAAMLVENAKIEKGRLMVVSRGNRSASLTTRNGEAYPMYFHVKTEWGEKKWRMGDRCASPLDSWPDPEVYIHYPSEQMLAYMDIRNINRTWPGRPNGLIVERTSAAFIEMIKRENVDLFIDLHEAELEYAVENTIVTHERGQEIAAMSSMTLTAQEFPVPIGMEFSPKGLHGLSHREVGDHSPAISILYEVAEPFLDRIRGITDEKLLMEGKDEFVMEAGKYGLLYAPMDENGWPIEIRVGRHSSTMLQSIEIFNMMNPGKEVVISNFPRYAEIVEKGLGGYFKDPAKVAADKIAFD